MTLAVSTANDPNRVSSTLFKLVISRADQNFDLNEISMTGTTTTGTINFNTRAGLDTDADLPVNGGVYYVPIGAGHDGELVELRAATCTSTRRRSGPWSAATPRIAAARRWCRTREEPPVMPLQKTPLAIQFAAGVDTKTDAKQIAVTKLIDLQNAVFLKNGTLSKRNGYRALGRLVDETGVPFGDPQGLAARGDELILFAGGSSYSYRPTSDSWQTIGPVQSIVASANPTARTGTDQTCPDVAVSNGVEVAAWQDNLGGVWYSVLEQLSQRVLLAPTQLDDDGSQPRCVAVGTVLHVIWISGGNLWGAIVNPSTPITVPTPQVIVNGFSGCYDVCPTFAQFYTAGPALLAWSSPSTGGYQVGYVHPSGVLGSPVLGLPSPGVVVTANPVTAIACAACLLGTGGASSVIVAYGSGDDALFQFHNSTNFGDLSGTSGNLYGSGHAPVLTVANLAVEYASATNAWWAVEYTGATADLHQVRCGNVPTTGQGSPSAIVRGHQLASRAFYDDGNVYCAIVHAVLFFPYVAIVALSADMAAQARLLPGLSTGALANPQLPGVVPLGALPTARQHLLALGYRIQLGGTSGTQFGEQGIQAFTLDYNHADSFHGAPLGRGLYLAGALIQHYDGSRWAEHNFHCAPDTYNGEIVTAQATGGSLTTASSYGYKIIYEEIDAQGELHPGPSSVTTLVALSDSNDQVTMTIPTCRLTSKQRVRIGVFRSLANATGAPTQIPYYRVSSVDPNASGPNGYLANDPGVDTITFVDNMSDATAETLEPLYTNGGILSNDPEQSGGVSIVGGKTRLFWLDPLDGKIVNYSQALRDDTAAELSAGLSVRVDPFGGDIVALAVMDDNVIVFKETAVFAFGGPGPDADGGIANPGDAWTPPQLCTTDVGCSSPSSVANVPDGIVFQSPKGPCLLGRDLQVKMIGDDVFAYRSQHISRATLLPDRPHIVFLTDVDQGRTLLYDYNRGAWSTFTNHVGIDALVLNGSYYYLGADRNVYVETPGAYRDGTRHIKRRVETAWIKFAGYLQGWQRVLHAIILGSYYSSHQLQVSYRLDYQDGYTVLSPVDVDAAYTPSNYGAGNYGGGNYGGTIGPNTVYQQQFHLNRRCQAISFVIEDTEDYDEYGAAFDLSELLLIGGVLGPKFMPGAARSQ